MIHQAIRLALLASIVFIFSACQPGSNQKEYPRKPLSYLVPWSPGGMTDGTSRFMSAVLQNAIGQPVNVINRTGGGGVVGHLALAQSRPDGYTVGAVTVEITMLRHMGLTDLSYQDYTPLALLINNPAAVTVRADAPWADVGDLVAALRQNPGTYQASGTARGGIWDLARLGFLQAAGLKDSDMPWVPSQGAAPALQELIAEGVDVVTASIPEVEGLRQAGQVKTLAIMADERNPRYPNIPTLNELGIDWSIGGWVSICAPKGLPAEVHQKLEEAVRVAANDTSFIEALENAGSTRQVLFGAPLKEFMAMQDEVNGRLMSDAGIAN
ncbi:MAG: tripartite tricarboxylate transporter substrate binding protein [Saprospiraceae bacterium]|nr:tripartite tricarboxylate transporter substrate binding protein [Saprospiraceae bacterium]